MRLLPLSWLALVFLYIVRIAKLKMKPKYQRFTLLILALISMSIGVMLILSALKDNIVFFYSPSDIVNKPPHSDQRIRVGGLVVDGSIKHQGNRLEFVVTDNVHVMQITYEGIPPGLFREGQGMVAEGHFKDGQFVATNLLAKHDENYMPPEVADAIKKSGHWKKQ